ncbi:hypothetical protein [Spirosoma foliorum]|uniref:Uncharacterized protein n=1 Tax=Spirosoma foliorum TaxID=2710596 RepID=A0A7G5H4Y0_9BACT|nr:hypothetical protein [Spirosoma foliorum]QMW06172.1 hypothetical protein H3H32_15415 [Spirosoma foliorum]
MQIGKQPAKLNEAQMVLLDLFQHRTMSADELSSLKRTLVRHLNAELDVEMDKVMQEKRITAKDVAIDAHFDNRTEHLKQIRNNL